MALILIATHIPHSCVQEFAIDTSMIIQVQVSLCTLCKKEGAIFHCKFSTYLSVGNSKWFCFLIIKSKNSNQYTLAWFMSGDLSLRT